MAAFTAAELAACRHLVELALGEDLGAALTTAGDVTSACFTPADALGTMIVRARQTGVLAGIQAAELVCARIDPELRFEARLADGARLQPGDAIARVTGSMASILAAERTALNFLQYLSGIATLTRQYVDAVAGLNVKILDTRKTLPGWRLLAKYAVRQGGGCNHRVGLFDMILVKDNHWAAHKTPGTLAPALADARRRYPGVPIEIEVESLPQLNEVLAAGPDIVLLDNMPVAMMREAAERRYALAPSILLEASGGVTLQTVRAIAETGIDRISVGALTHSAPALDIALDYEDVA
jgi:nicotinate-nucleotide pyrophosphorylase (carboxylating)